jgi:signal transduction histidine kinase
MFSAIKKFLSGLETPDLWFLALRLVTILVGIAWYVWVPYDPSTRSIFGLLLSGFVAYTTVLYICAFLWPQRIKGLYLLALVIDLWFIFFLIRYVGQFQGSFFIAFYLLVGLHSFYFGPLVGFFTAATASGLYAYLYFHFDRPLLPPEFLLRISFLFLIAACFGFLSRKERKDREKIERLNQELGHRNEVLMQVYRYLSIGRLAPSIAEKVNNPIGVIMARAAILQTESRQRGLPSDVVEGLGVILSHAAGVASIFRTLVSLITPRSAERARVDLNEIAKSALWLMGGRFEERQIQVIPRFSQAASFIRANAQEIQEAVLHLLNNAVDALGRGGTIEVETSCDGDPPNKVFLKIADDGNGIRKEDLEKIFIPFFSTKAGQNGVGLGLSVALNIVKRHDGIISIQSEPGKGTTLFLSFPSCGRFEEGASS